MPTAEREDGPIMPSLKVIISCDCDPDRPEYGGARYDSLAPLVWRGVTEGIPRLAEALDGLAAEFGARPVVTWCVRADLQLAELCGDAAWAYNEFRDLWESLEAAGDEIGWHPHLWRRDRDANCWFQETRDTAWIEDCLQTGYEALTGAMGRPPRSVRMGWEYHNNTTMHALDRLGIAADLSASARRYLAGGPDSGGSRFDQHVDWAITGEEPYYPSAADYRRPARAGEQSLSILEVPVTSYWAPWPKLASMGVWASQGRGLGILRRLVDIGARRRPVKPPITVAPRWFAPLVSGRVAVACSRGDAVMHCTFHCDEASSASGSIYSLEALRRNLRSVISGARRKQAHIRWLPASSAGDECGRPAETTRGAGLA